MIALQAPKAPTAAQLECLTALSGLTELSFHDEPPNVSEEHVAALARLTGLRRLTLPYPCAEALMQVSGYEVENVLYLKASRRSVLRAS